MDKIACDIFPLSCLTTSLPNCYTLIDNGSSYIVVLCLIVAMAVTPSLLQTFSAQTLTAVTLDRQNHVHQRRLHIVRSITPQLHSKLGVLAAAECYPSPNSRLNYHYAFAGMNKIV